MRTGPVTATSSPPPRLISRSVGIPVVASGGAGKPEHLVAVFKEAGADAALIASMVHYGEWTIAGIKEPPARQAGINGQGYLIGTHGGCVSPWAQGPVAMLCDCSYI